MNASIGHNQNKNRTAHPLFCSCQVSATVPTKYRLHSSPIYLLPFQGSINRGLRPLVHTLPHYWKLVCIRSHYPAHIHTFKYYRALAHTGEHCRSLAHANKYCRAFAYTHLKQQTRKHAQSIGQMPALARTKGHSPDIHKHCLTPTQAKTVRHSETLARSIEHSHTLAQNTENRLIVVRSNSQSAKVSFFLRKEFCIAIRWRYTTQNTAHQYFIRMHRHNCLISLKCESA